MLLQRPGWCSALELDWFSGNSFLSFLVECQSQPQNITSLGAARMWSVGNVPGCLQLWHCLPIKTSMGACQKPISQNPGLAQGDAKTKACWTWCIKLSENYIRKPGTVEDLWWEHGLGVDLTSNLDSISCVTLGKLLYFSDLQFPHL